VNEDKSSRYHRLNRRATLAWTIVAGTALVGLVWGGGSRAIRDLAAAATAASPAAPSTVAVYALLLVLGYYALRFPLAVYQGFVLERRYGLSTERLSVWARDHLRAALLVGTLTVGAAEVVYVSQRWSAEWWWVVSAACFIAGLLILARVAPVVILPLFYRFEPLERESLRGRLHALSERAGIPVLGTYVWGLGARSRRANAALIGSGPTRRILLSDTLLADYSDDEIEVILAHELAHHVHRDIWAGIAFETGLIVAGLFIADRVVEASAGPLGLAGKTDLAALPLIILTMGGVSLLLMPLANAFSRAHERRADRYALDLTSNAGGFVSAMKRLAAQNLAEERPSRLVELLFHSHPSTSARIAAAQAWSARDGELKTSD